MRTWNAQESMSKTTRQSTKVNHGRGRRYFCGSYLSRNLRARVRWARATTQWKEHIDGMKELNLELEKLEPRIAPGLLDGITDILCPPPPDYCPPPPPEDCPPPPPDDCPPADSVGGNNGYGNGGDDGVPGSSADNDSPNADEKEADVVR